MKRDLRVLAAAGSLVLAFSIGEAAFAQKTGWHSEDLLFRQSGEHVDPRGNDGCRPRTDDGGLQ
jgi:hypothetical protein